MIEKISSHETMVNRAGPFNFFEDNDKEWLETNGAGAFASSSIIECHTRKYHGLLVTPLPGQEGRFVLLSSLDASFKINDSEFFISTNRYPGTIFPRGYECLKSFFLFPVPTWIYQCRNVVIKKEIFMLPENPSVFAVYTLLSGRESLDLEIKPLLLFRNSHQLSRANGMIDPRWKTGEQDLRCKPYSGLPGLIFHFSGGWEAREDFHWEYNVEYSKEEERGFDFSEDRFFPGYIRANLKIDEPWILQAGADLPGEGAGASVLEEPLAALYAKLMERRKAEASRLKTPWDLLSHNARHFFVSNTFKQKSITAGYPWFGEWGRDTMIALPGLTFFNRRFEEGRTVLRDYSALIKDGLLPNTLGQMQGFTSYNSIDGGLLYFWAFGKMLEYADSEAGGGEKKNELIREFLPPLEAILKAFLENRVPHCRLGEQGLLDTGSPDTQLTWMDATAWGRPVTPRYGYAVELNALWYNSLKLYTGLWEAAEKAGASWPDISGTDISRYKTTGEKAASLLAGLPEVFLETFWYPEKNCLSDTVVPPKDGWPVGPDGKIRPNMLFASSLPGLLPPENAAAVVERAKKELLIPWGLRTLSPADPDYRGSYQGDGNTRDSRYHQGTAWPWLLGVMVESSLLAAENRGEAYSQALSKEVDFWENYLNRLLLGHLGCQGLGFVSEVFDGDAGMGAGPENLPEGNPPPGKGCFAQAWSVGEILRCRWMLEKVKTKYGAAPSSREYRK